MKKVIDYVIIVIVDNFHQSLSKVKKKCLLGLLDSVNNKQRDMKSEHKMKNMSTYYIQRG